MRNEVEQWISSPHLRWYPGLASELAELCWTGLTAFGVNSANYSTVRSLECNPLSAREGFFLDDTGWRRPLLLEPYGTSLVTHYGHLRLRPPAAMNAGEFGRRLSAAMAILDLIPSVGDAVRALVWSLVAVDVEGADYDTGYSDPGVPFSIFIGVHPGLDNVPAIRLAEGILHEAMHLQLSLIEDVVPLIAGNTDLRVSPWQRRPRPMQGLLHGLYVFRVIQDWLSAMHETHALGSQDWMHAEKRLAEIEAECACLRGISSSPDLTKDGRVLASRLAAGPAGPRSRAS